MRVKDLLRVDREHSLVCSIQRAYRRRVSGSENLTPLRVEGVDSVYYLSPYLASERSTIIMDHIKSTATDNDTSHHMTKPIKFPFLESWSGEVLQAVCEYIEVGHYEFTRPIEGRRLKGRPTRSGQSRQVQAVLFHVRVGEALALWKVETGPDAAFTEFKHTLTRTIEDTEGFMLIVEFILSNPWIAGESLLEALYEAIYSRPHISQFDKYSPLLRAVESNQDFLNGLINHIMEAETLRSVPEDLAGLLERKHTINQNRIRQGLPLIPVPPQADERPQLMSAQHTAADTATDAIAHVATTVATTTTTTEATTAAPAIEAPTTLIVAEVTQPYSVVKEIQQPITLAENFLQYYGWQNMQVALVLERSFRESLIQIKTAEQFEVVVGRVWVMWQDGNQHIRSAVADFCISNAHNILQTPGLEQKLRKLPGLADEISKKISGW